MSNSGYQIALFILQKISCSLSAIGSLMIVSQVTRNKFNRSKPQQRLILGLSISDLCTSLVWIFTPLFMPAYSGALWAMKRDNMQYPRFHRDTVQCFCNPLHVFIAIAIPPDDQIWLDRNKN